MKTLFLFFFCCITLSLFAQPSLEDSLQTVIHRHQVSKDGIAECDALVELATLYQKQKLFTQADSVLQLLNTKATTIDFKKGQVDYTRLSGMLIGFQGRPAQAIEFLEKEINQFETYLESEKVIETYIALSHFTYLTGQKEKCYAFSNKALEYLPKASSPLLKGRILSRVANRENAWGTQKKAIQIAQEAYDYMVLAKDTASLLSNRYNIGLYFYQDSAIDSCYTYLENNVALAKEFDSNHWIIENLSLLTQIALQFGEGERALKYLEEAMPLARAGGDERLIGNLNISLGRAHLINNEPETGKALLEKALNTGLEQKILQLIVPARRYLIQYYQEQNNLEKALSLVKDNYTFLGEQKDIQGQAAMLGYMGDIYRNMRQYEDAVEAHQKAVQITKSNKKEHLLPQFYFGIIADYEKLEQPDSMLYYIQQAKILLGENISLNQKIELEQGLFTAYKLEGDFETALAHHEKLADLRNKSYLKDTKSFIAEESVKQDVETIEQARLKAEQDAVLLSARNKLYLAIAIGLLGILLIGGYLYRLLRQSKLQIESQNIQLQQLNATKDKFFGIIAHDIRSPIVALEGVGEQMEYYVRKNNPEKLRRLASRVDTTAKRLNGLLDNLLNWALLQQGVIPYHPKALNVLEVTQNIFAMFQHNADAKGIMLQTNMDENIQILADESAVNTIFRNLVSNAIKFTPNGGTVSIGTETKANKVFITINDTGTGIAAHQLEKLFTLEKKSELGTAGEKGTGLGLTLVKELVELNKGVLSVNSQINQGTQFTVALPLAA